MLWFAVWAVLVLLAVLLLGRLTWTVVRKGVALTGELARAAERGSAVAAEVQRLGRGGSPAPLAVFADPAELRRERRRRQRARRRRRPGRSLPGA